MIQLPFKPRGLAVRYRTFLCDARGRVERPLQSGRNMVTDFGMDSLGTALLHTLVTHLNLSSATQTMKRVPLAGNALTVDSSGGAGTLLLECSANFFEAADVGRTLKIDGWPELLVTGYTDAQHVAATARNAEWLPGFTPDTDPHDGDWGVHYTNTATLQTEFTRFNTLDTSDPVPNGVLNDSANSRWIHRRVWLSGIVSGSPWTVNQLGWSANSVNCFGKANLNSPDAVPVDKRYRVELEIYSVLTPIDLTGVSLDFGPIVGTHVCDLRMERIPKEGINFSANDGNHFLLPPVYSTNATNQLINVCHYTTAAMSLQSILWEGDPGFGGLTHSFSAPASGQVYAGAAYVNGTHYMRKDLRWAETSAFTGATALIVTTEQNTAWSNANGRTLIIRPQTGTITKPGGWRIEVRLPIRWTRELVN